MSTLITIIHVTACVFLVLMVLIQSGKGAEISASFGGSSQTVFGSSGGANFFVKLTGALAAIFFVTSLALTVMGGQGRKSLFETSALPQSTGDVTQQAAPTGAAPAAPQGQAEASKTAPAEKPAER